jgi:hypothetical protein
VIHPHPRHLITPPADRVPPLCPYCRRRSELMDSAAVYGEGRSYGPMWVCARCEAWVGCHKNSSDYAPLGRLANGPLRKLKMRVHDLLDPWWRDQTVGTTFFRRKAMYALLAEEMRIPKRECHVADFDDAKCEHAIFILESTRWRLLAAGAITHATNET